MRLNENEALVGQVAAFDAMGILAGLGRLSARLFL